MSTLEDVIEEHHPCRVTVTCSICDTELFNTADPKYSAQAVVSALVATIEYHDNQTGHREVDVDIEPDKMEVLETEVNITVKE